jgi:hypothetical protein
MTEIDAARVGRLKFKELRYQPGISHNNTYMIDKKQHKTQQQQGVPG